MYCRSQWSLGDPLIHKFDVSRLKKIISALHVEMTQIYMLSWGCHGDHRHCPMCTHIKCHWLWRQKFKDTVHVLTKATPVASSLHNNQTHTHTLQPTTCTLRVLQMLCNSKTTCTSQGHTASTHTCVHVALCSTTKHNRLITVLQRC